MDYCTTSRFKVYARGSVMSAIITDARLATIGTSVRIKRQKQHVLGLNLWQAWLNEKNLLLDHNKIHVFHINTALQ